MSPSEPEPRSPSHVRGTEVEGTGTVQIFPGRQLLLAASGESEPEHRRADRGSARDSEPEL
jgi:hypothetical protein